MASRLAQSAEEDKESVATKASVTDALQHVRNGSPFHVLRVRIGVSTIKPSMTGMFPLFPIKKGNPVFHFHWRDHAGTTPANKYPPAVWGYLDRIWASLVPYRLTFEPVNFLNHSFDQPTVFYNQNSGDYLATRDLTPDDEITINYVGYNDSRLAEFYNEMTAEEQALIPRRWCEENLHDEPQVAWPTEGLSTREKASIEQLEAMGIPLEEAAKTFLACGKNLETAVQKVRASRS